MSTADRNEALLSDADAGGSYLSFALGDEAYGLEILRVQGIIGLMPITEVPRTPACVRGVINLRGRIIPVIDVRTLFGMEGFEDNERTCIIIVQLGAEDGNGRVGLLVDAVREVLEVDERAVEHPPILSNNEELSFIRGVARSGDDVLMLLHLDRLLSESQKSVVLDVTRMRANGNATERESQEPIAHVTEE